MFSKPLGFGLFFGLCLPLFASCSDDDSSEAPGPSDAGAPSAEGGASSGGSSSGGASPGGSAGAAPIDGGSAGEASPATGGSAGEPASPPGALIRVTAESTVGFLLDELPESLRDRVAADLLDGTGEAFVDRARRQLRLATYRLNFRPAFYDEAEEKRQLPLPPAAVQRIRLVPDATGALARRDTVQGHDYVLADYELETVLVTDAESPGISEPALAEVGGEWVEHFTFPVDPELLIQRTGYACMDEAEFPRNSVDTENVEFFYDQECEPEDVPSLDGCHQTELPTLSCLDALEEGVGSVDLDLHYERLAWDEELAADNRVGQVGAEGVADLEVVTEELADNRLTYRYIEADSCALDEACVGGPGWRRLLQFNASEKNVGTEPINIGDVDYYIDNPDDPTANANHHVYQYSACHNHYHFNYFATFSYGGDPDLGSKRAFCLESVARYSNHEHSPTWSDYNGCDYQGITQGWGDQYNAGIECQWVDVTTVDTSEGPVTQPLGLRSNPEGFLCEGAPVLDDEGNVTWEPTELRTDMGDTVDRPVCDERTDWEENNYGEHDVTLPVPGEGYLTSACKYGELGPLRNCGFTYEPSLVDCEPGETVSVSCSVEDGSLPQVARLCEASRVHDAGVACFVADALANGSVTEGETTALSFTCPERRDNQEPGGKYALYFGPLWPSDATAPVTCVTD